MGVIRWFNSLRAGADKYEEVSDTLGTGLPVQVQNASSITIGTVDTELDAARAAADANSLPTTADVLAALFGYNGTTLDLLRALGDNADAVAAAALGRLATVSRQYGFNGATWDRLRVDGNKSLRVVCGGYTINASANFTRPGDTTAYASGDLVANDTVAANVVPLSFTAARNAAGSGLIRRARLKKSGTTVTNASFRLHLYGADPSASTGITNGDNGAWLTKQATYLGSIDLDMTAANGRVFSDAAEVIGVPAVGSDIAFALASGTTVYGLLEARAAYTPVSGEVFTAELEILQD